MNMMCKIPGKSWKTSEKSGNRLKGYRKGLEVVATDGRVLERTGGRLKGARNNERRQSGVGD